jgi:murein DD-endopeptidase MepM/ murein hydrolase activator NlpD
MRRRRYPVYGVVAVLVALALCSTVPPTRVVPLEAGVAAPVVANLGPTPGERWFDEVLAVLAEPTAVEVPFVQRGLVGAGAAAFEFEAVAGQTLEVTLERNAGVGDAVGVGDAGTRVYVEVFRTIDVLGHALHERLAALPSTKETLRTRLPSAGAYRVLVQPEDAAPGRYRLILELDAVLPFPVLGVETDAIRSRFGASRDAGKRHHEGIDIYAQRLTPVLAVAAGTAMPRQDALGGNTVWLNTPGTSYYYAHLDRVAVRDNQRVRSGDVLGYVGNTGNARNTPAHLHFGVYRWGREPVDPLPLLVARRLPSSNRADGEAEQTATSTRRQTLPPATATGS